MADKNGVALTGAETIELARKCLTLISQIAARGASSQNPDNIGHALQELTQVLFERTGSDETLFEPVPADQLRNLPSLYDELDFVDTASQHLAASALLRQKDQIPGSCQQ